MASSPNFGKSVFFSELHGILRTKKVSLPIDVCRTPLLELPIKRRNEGILKRTKKVRSASCHNAIMEMVRKDVRNFASAVKKMLKQGK